MSGLDIFGVGNALGDLIETRVIVNSLAYGAVRGTKNETVNAFRHSFTLCEMVSVVSGTSISVQVKANNSSTGLTIAAGASFIVTELN